jgi:3-hydroxyisobutyrate dehydrogenase-like beta-hydroxyacid dehydrogenase
MDPIRGRGYSVLALPRQRRSFPGPCDTQPMDLQSGTVVGLLHPGEMGTAVGRCLTERGYTVLWASQGRSPETEARAKAAGLTDAGTPRELAAQAGVIISVCPPHAALDVAWAVHGFTGVYLDANAISPDTAREVARLINGNGGRYVDGGIIGSPPFQAGTTRLYLSGDDAHVVQELFDGTALEPRIAGGSPTAASGVKMAYAAWTKGTAALLLAARALARAEGVEDALLAEWALSQPHLAERSAGTARSGVTKGWRWVGEMEEIAQSMAGAGLPDGFHQAAAEIFRRCPRLPDAFAGPELTATVLRALAGSD